MRWTRATLLAVAALGMVASRAPGVAPYDFAGTWTGAATERGKTAVTFTVDLAGSGGKAFTGTIVAARDGRTPAQCAAKGKVQRRLTVSMRATCDDGGVLTFHGRVHADTQTIAGGFVER